MEYAFTRTISRINAAPRGGRFPGDARRQALDAKRFDELAMALAESESSRRSVVHRVFGGGLAALLAALGLAGPFNEQATAQKKKKKKRRGCPGKCRRRKKLKARRRCRLRCRTAPARDPRCRSNAECVGNQVCLNGGCVVPGGPCSEDGDECGALLCIAGECVISDECSDSDPCTDPLICVLGVCVADDECEGDDDCDDPLICLLGQCIGDTECEGDDDCTDPLLSLCVLGLCVNDPLDL
jgi:hypothetical protein